MLYISTALYVEAQPIITIHSLKQQHEHTKFQIFESNTICLIITGVGELKASIAITYLFSHKTIGPHDLFLNFGLCGTTDSTISLGSIYAFHKLKDFATKRDLYPDMLLRLPFKESSLETCPLQVGKSISPNLISEPFVDMEAYAIMYAITYYMQPHQLLFLKVVSDYATNESDVIVNPDTIHQQLTKAVLEISSFLKEYSNEFVFFSQSLESTKLSLEENHEFQLLIQQLHLSKTMSHTLKQHIIYYKNRHTNADSVLSEFLTNPALAICKSKTEGKKYFGQLKSKLME